MRMMKSKNSQARQKSRKRSEPDYRNDYNFLRQKIKKTLIRTYITNIEKNVSNIEICIQIDGVLGFWGGRKSRKSCSREFWAVESAACAECV